MFHIFTGILLVVFFTATLFADVINVPGDQVSIQAGIDAAVDSDTVLVAEGTYLENIKFKGKAITVASQYFWDSDTSHISNTIIDGSSPSNADSGSVVTFESGEDSTSVLNGFTITRGSGTRTQYSLDGETFYSRAGGGILCYNSGARILNNKITNNVVNAISDAVGGGIAVRTENYYSPLIDIIIDGNDISDNKVVSTNYSSGGGIGGCYSGQIINNTISQNSCVSLTLNAYAGGVGCNSNPLAPCKLNIINNQIINNSASSSAQAAFAGGIYIYGVEAHVRENNISFNKLNAHSTSFAFGAGIYCMQAIYLIINKNDLLQNYVSSGDGRGGGLYLYDCQYEVTDNVIKNNQATHGGGIRITATPVNKFGQAIPISAMSISEEGGLLEPNHPGNRHRGLNGKHNVSIKQYVNKISSNRITKNSVTGFGGGINMTNSDPVFIKCLITNNSAVLDGGGLVLGNCDAQLINCTVANNASTGLGGGGIDLYSDSDPFIENTIIYENTNKRGLQQVYLKVIKCDPDFKFCDIQGGLTGIQGRGSGSYFSGIFENCIDNVPIFVDLVNYYLSENSDCIDAGNPNHYYNDKEDPNNSGYALWPAMGELLNDMGSYGGNSDNIFNYVSGFENDPEKEYMTKNFVLLQNYPNPFNPNTTIRYQIKTKSDVQLIIYDITGREITTLINQRQNAGEHSVKFDATGLASGIYFYRLKTSSGFEQSREMVLLR